MNFLLILRRLQSSLFTWLANSLPLSVIRVCIGPKLDIQILKIASETVGAFLFGRAAIFVNFVNASVMTKIQELPLDDFRIGP